MPPPTTISPLSATIDNFQPDDKAMLRLLVVVISILVVAGICAFIRCYRASGRSRVRRYDLLSNKQLAPDNFRENVRSILNSESDVDSEDELFRNAEISDDRRQLVTGTQ